MFAVHQYLINISSIAIQSSPRLWSGPKFSQCFTNINILSIKILKIEKKSHWLIVDIWLIEDWGRIECLLMLRGNWAVIERPLIKHWFYSMFSVVLTSTIAPNLGVFHDRFSTTRICNLAMLAFNTVEWRLNLHAYRPAAAPAGVERPPPYDSAKARHTEVPFCISFGNTKSPMAKAKLALDPWGAHTAVRNYNGESANIAEFGPKWFLPANAS